jgi:hypothetical protein
VFFTFLGLETDFLRDSLEVVLLALDRRRFLLCIILFCDSSSVSSSFSGFDMFPDVRKECLTKMCKKMKKRISAFVLTILQLFYTGRR